MPRQLIYGLLFVLFTVSANAQTLTHIDLSPAFNADLILNTGDTPPSNAGSIDGAGFAYLTNTRALAFDNVNGNGLPDSGFFPSTSTGVPFDVQLAYSDSDNGNNAILFTHSGGQSATVSLPVSQQGEYSSLYMLAAAGVTTATLDVEFTYSDLSTSTQNGISVNDWFADSGSIEYLIDGMDRYHPGTMDLQNSNDPAIFAFALSPDPLKTLTAIEFERTNTNAGRIAIIGVSGLAESAVVPEPASIAIWSILAVGLAGFSYCRIRRRN